jgi:hypothetical protein
MSNKAIPSRRAFLSNAFIVISGAELSKIGLTGGYQYYFATERGRAGYEKYRDEFAKLIWQIASPKWNFDDATFNPK